MSLSCAARSLPPPEQTAQEYARLVQAGDASALHELLSSDAQAALSEEDVAELLRANRAELQTRAQALESQPLLVESSAVLYLDRGDAVTLAVEDGEFRVAQTGLLPTPAKTPHSAVEKLKAALAAQDLGRVLKLVAPELRERIEESVSTLNDALARLDQALIDINEDRAVVTLPGGVILHLREIDHEWLITEVP